MTNQVQAKVMIRKYQSVVIITCIHVWSKINELSADIGDHTTCCYAHFPATCIPLCHKSLCQSGQTLPPACWLCNTPSTAEGVVWYMRLPYCADHQYQLQSLNYCSCKFEASNLYSKCCETLLRTLYTEVRILAVYAHVHQVSELAGCLSA